MEKNNPSSYGDIFYLKFYNTIKNIGSPRPLGKHLMVLFFYKYVSDIWEDAFEKHSKVYVDREMVARKMSRERFNLNDALLFKSIVSRSKNTDIGHDINIVLANIEELNAPYFEDIFRHVDFNDEYILGDINNRGRIISELLLFFLLEVDLKPSNIHQQTIIDTCITVIGYFSEVVSRRGDEFFTPPAVCNILTQLLDPKEGARIYDPCCGGGGLLISAAKAIGNTENYALYGQDISKEILAWGKMNMYVHGLNGFHLAWGDVIKDPVWREDKDLMKFDIIVSNPPFNINQWAVESASNDIFKRFEWGIPPATKGDYAFLEHMLASLDINGRMGVIVPQSVLFREGKELPIREAIIKDNLIEAVIALPTNLFFHTSIPSAILLFNKAKADDNILFINASRMFVAAKSRNLLLDSHIQDIVSTYRFFKAGKEVNSRYSRIVAPDEIESNNYNLSVFRYVDTNKEDKEVIDLNELKNEIATLESELEVIKANIKNGMKTLGIF